MQVGKNHRPVCATVANDEVKSILNKVSAGLTTADLVGLNAKVSLEHQDPDAVAKAYLEQKNYFS